jgi:hypothetical protein
MVYPVLHSLEARGLLKAREKITDGRARIYYSVAAKGKTRQKGLLLAKLLKLLAAALLVALPPQVRSQPTSASEAPEEFVVVGRQPGPPLWRVTNGDKVLWIFPYLSPVPKDMIWETDKVEKLVAEAQELILMPQQGASASPLLVLNPINLFRGWRLAKRLVRNPDGASLQDSLPPDLHARFATLQARYFPRENDVDELRPIVAGGRMSSIIQREEGLVDGGDILASLRRLTRRNKDAVRTDVSVNVELEGSFRDLARRAETMMESLEPAQELACFEQQLLHMEQDLEYMKSRANAWARGYVDEFRDIPLVGEEGNACMDLIAASSERELILEIETRMRTMWLQAAERALATNHSTFAILPIDSLISADGLLSELKAKGYEVREP